MALDQLKAFLIKMQDDEGLKSRVLSASTADDVAKIAAKIEQLEMRIEDLETEIQEKL